MSRSIIVIDVIFHGSRVYDVRISINKGFVISSSNIIKISLANRGSKLQILPLEAGLTIPELCRCFRTYLVKTLVLMMAMQAWKKN